VMIELFVRQLISTRIVNRKWRQRCNILKGTLQHRDTRREDVEGGRFGLELDDSRRGWSGYGLERLLHATYER